MLLATAELDRNLKLSMVQLPVISEFQLGLEVKSPSEKLSVSWATEGWVSNKTNVVAAGIVNRFNNKRVQKWEGILFTQLIVKSVIKNTIFAGPFWSLPK